MRIPETITIAGQVVSITVDNTLDRQDEFGDSMNIRNKIRVCTTFKGEEVPKSQTELSLIHELTHQVLDKLGYHDLSSDEKFVEQFSLLWHQVILSLEEEKK